MKILLIWSCLMVIFGRTLGLCEDECDQHTLIYDELGCKPVHSPDGGCCPIKYDCSHIAQRTTKKEQVCHFHGKTYALRESINQDEIYGNCKVGCFCNKGKNDNMLFVCAVLDCPEYLHGFIPPGCHPRYDINKCCKIGNACPPFNVTCEVNGKTYHDGQKFSAPDKKCVKCVCNEGFAGKFEEPFCKKRTCIDEVKFQQEVQRFCAPSYVESDSCCPLTWICPEGDERIIPAEKQSSDPDLKCKFGDRLLNVGDKFEKTSGTKGYLKCECRVPPYITCVQNFDYPFYSSKFH